MRLRLLVLITFACGVKANDFDVINSFISNLPNLPVVDVPNAPTFDLPTIHAFSFPEIQAFNLTAYLPLYLPSIPELKFDIPQVDDRDFVQKILGGNQTIISMIFNPSSFNLDQFLRILVDDLCEAFYKMVEFAEQFINTGQCNVFRDVLNLAEMTAEMALSVIDDALALMKMTTDLANGDYAAAISNLEQFSLFKMLFYNEYTFIDWFKNITFDSLLGNLKNLGYSAENSVVVYVKLFHSLINFQIDITPQDIQIILFQMLGIDCMIDDMNTLIHSDNPVEKFASAVDLFIQIVLNIPLPSVKQAQTVKSFSQLFLKLKKMFLELVGSFKKWVDDLAKTFDDLFRSAKKYCTSKSGRDECTEEEMEARLTGICIAQARLLHIDVSEFALKCKYYQNGYMFKCKHLSCASDHYAEQDLLSWQCKSFGIGAKWTYPDNCKKKCSSYSLFDIPFAYSYQRQGNVYILECIDGFHQNSAVFECDGDRGFKPNKQLRTVNPKCELCPAWLDYLSVLNSNTNQTGVVKRAKKQKTVYQYTKVERHVTITKAEESKIITCAKGAHSKLTTHPSVPQFEVSYLVKYHPEAGIPVYSAGVIDCLWIARKNLPVKRPGSSTWKKWRNPLVPNQNDPQYLKGKGSQFARGKLVLIKFFTK
jgi:hypothetical protein